MATFRDIVKYYRPYRAIALLSIAAASLFEIVDLAVPYTIGQILNVLSGQPLDALLQKAIDAASALTGMPANKLLSLAVLLSVIFLVTVVRAPIQPWISSWFHWDIALRSRRDYSGKAIEKVLTLPLEFYDENNPGRIAGKVARGIANHTWSYPEIAGQLIPKLGRVLGIFVIIWLIEWRIAILFLISFVFILTFSIKDLKTIIKIEERLDKYAENTESRNSEIITNIKTVKAFATEKQELKRQRERLEREFKVVDYRVHKGYVKLNTWQRTVIQFCVFTVLGLTLAATVGGKISLGHFVTTLTVSSMAYAELEPISNLAEVFARRYASMLRFHEFMQQPSGADSKGVLQSQILSTSTTPYKFTGKVEFCQVSFGYDPSRQVLQDINLLIEPCQTVALVGRSGSGKSTLVKLLFRYFEANRGRILIDGEDIRSLDVTAYRHRLAIVHQEVDIFNGTLLDNLRYGNLNASLEQVQAACRIARLDEVIQQMPQGYHTLVGERGVRLSGGQRQRLGIARALLVDPDILIFDEATSSLDYESERSIQLAMRSILGTRTAIVIAHRLSTVREADKIVVLDRGQIVEVGNHAELLRQEGIYRRLHLLQETGELL
ncbi:ABC transporter ATP-binding protein [Planktothrix sp. FACHB-1355]|uniref:ABC transporter ATP-binding protein n=1 Tax=Aerosakkonema funiforme FACHB-1375 TaxID=2949571 RepID=A0A926VEK8_9CYAN|nr:MULTISPECIES: ABC transporter ATP-binding protein [Oscillatoriales]MBD2182267.1 ABC transporter ATP-binding protein [Aerosakkonema funiforme FACHB-1375]MBD3558057.1 ABC transporter ATP-binding protein [Planktothrix sp. FACHB-1355]